MPTILIGLGEFAVCTRPGDVIRTLGLGSCVAITAIHGSSGAIGMAHIVLPESRTDLVKARLRPAYFADTAVRAMFDEMNRVTQAQDRYLVKLVGGAAVLSTPVANANMNIGERNLIATRKALGQRGLGAIAEDVGGAVSRSVSLTHGQLQVEISNGGKTMRMI